MRRGIIVSVAFQDAKRTGDGLIYILCKGWNRHRGLLRGALRAMRDGVTAVAHLAPHCPRRSALMIPQPPSTTLPLAMMPRIPISQSCSISLPISAIFTILETRFGFFTILPIFHHLPNFHHLQGGDEDVVPSSSKNLDDNIIVQGR